MLFYLIFPVIAVLIHNTRSALIGFVVACVVSGATQGALQAANLGSYAYMNLITQLPFFMAGLAAYVAISQTLGFIISSLIYVPWFIRYFGRYSHGVAWSCAFGIAAFIYLVFIRLLQLTLPIGPLSFLG